MKQKYKIPTKFQKKRKKIIKCSIKKMPGPNGKIESILKIGYSNMRVKLILSRGDKTTQRMKNEPRNYHNTCRQRWGTNGLKELRV